MSLTVELASDLRRLANALMVEGLTVATAESCTGGGIGAAFTDLAGSSAWFNGGIISYTNEAKQHLLGVSAQTLIDHGAVSEEVVQQMVTGACGQLNTDMAVAVSGVAGPDGGSAEKPVGTVWIAWAKGGAEGQTTSRCFLFKGDRQAVREATVEAAVTGLLGLLEADLGRQDNP